MIVHDSDHEKNFSVCFFDGTISKILTNSSLFFFETSRRSGSALCFSYPRLRSSPNSSNETNRSWTGSSLLVAGFVTRFSTNNLTHSIFWIWCLLRKNMFYCLLRTRSYYLRLFGFRCLLRGLLFALFRWFSFWGGCFSLTRHCPLMIGFIIL